MNSIINGLIAGYIGAFCVYPIDFIKTHSQNNSIVQFKNIKTMYRGIFIQLIGIGPEKTIKLFINDKLINNNINPIIAGCCAGAGQVLVTNPIEYIKIQFQMHKSFQVNDLKNIYRGVFCCLLRDIPFSGIYFPLYTQLKTKYNSFISGLLAGIPSAYLVTPFDVIKTRIQTRPHIYKNITQTIMLIYKEEGYKAFYKGGLWRIAKSGPQFGITLFIYDYLCKFY